MIVAEPYQKNGRTALRNIRNEPTLPPGYVELVAMPSGFGPWVYDEATKTAIPAALTEAENLDRLTLPPRVLAALVARAAPSSTPAQRAWAGHVLDAALVQIEDARSASAPSATKGA